MSIKFLFLSNKIMGIYAQQAFFPVQQDILEIQII